MASGATPNGSYTHSWKDGTEYEVKCQQTFAYYTGYVVDYDAENQKFHVCYENGWKADERVNPSEIRPKAFQHEPDQWQPKENEKVEAKAKSEENEPFGWWPCFIRCIKGEFFLVNFEGWDDTHNEILGKEMLRPFNNKPAIRAAKMDRQIVPIGEDKAQAEWLASKPEELVDLQQKTGLVHISIRQTNGSNEIILIGEKKGIKRAELLLRNMLEYQRELSEIRTDLVKVQKQLQEKEQQFRTAYKESFQVDVALLPLVIGRKGKNIKDAEGIQGVLKINVDDNGQVTIFAKNTDAASEAREILEIISKDVPVPSSAMGRIIGNKGTNIQKIIKDSQVIRIKSQPQKSGENGMDYFLVTGTCENVETASILIESQLRHIDQLDTLRQQQQQTQEELRENYGGSGSYGGGYGGPRGDGGGRRGRNRRGGGRMGGGGGDRGSSRRQGGRGGGRGGGGSPGNRSGGRSGRGGRGQGQERDGSSQDKPAREGRSNRSKGRGGGGGASNRRRSNNSEPKQDKTKINAD